MEFDDDLNACAAIVEKGDPARFRTVMAAPVPARAKLFPLYALNVEVSRAPWVTEEPMIAEMRLQWWRDALEEIGSGGVVRRHEVVTPLSVLLDADAVALLGELVVARRWDCYKDPFKDESALKRYLQQTSGNLMQVACTVLGDDRAPGAAMGYALGVANWLRACPELEAKGRIPLVDGTRTGIQNLASSGLAALRGLRVPMATPARPALWPAEGAERVLKLAMRKPHRVASGRLPLAGPSPTTLALKAILASEAPNRKKRWWSR